MVWYDRFHARAGKKKLLYLAMFQIISKEWRARLRKLIALSLMVVLAGCATSGSGPHKHDKFTKHYDKSLYEVTKKGMFGVEMVVKEHVLKTGVNSLDLIIHDINDKDVVGAEITVTPWMPEMGHGVFDKPLITEKGGGLYTVENIILVMSGHWELRVNIKNYWNEDSVVFDFPDVKVDRGHEHKITQAPADLNLGVKNLSENKIFSVSYMSSREPVPINKIHMWELTVETPDGSPVTGAVISLDGDMPEHGHGLPTQPEVTDDLGNGKYMVEGIKFSMPGWWVMKFNIQSGDREDNVTFNLLLKE